MSLLNFAHLGFLLFSMAGMVIVDAREKLFFFRSPWRAAVVTVTGVAFFLLWDIAGIVHGIFLHGSSELDSGILLGPEMPLEEVVFLTFLCYLTMNLVVLVERLFAYLARQRGGNAREVNQP
ncbi:lycopene cyclase domain-containing protein [Kocuria sp.]|uniref:lycopene cyclase domain-containing protein n=1 Tax=Kocuria sp. TaxID=1871328 RepID=UPI0026DFCF52|nr:lycopene cyclase domain-containing protein [Kocuria sp.]MDO5617688.1 lycopene cyclase domain-containing protein [Kocuria sp.]